MDLDHNDVISDLLKKWFLTNKAEWNKNKQVTPYEPLPTMNSTLVTVALMVIALSYSEGRRFFHLASKRCLDAEGCGNIGQGSVQARLDQTCSKAQDCTVNNTECRYGSCHCLGGFYGSNCERIHKYHTVQVHEIVTIEDHPWVIVNQSCLTSGAANESSCRHTPCYTGFLVDLLQKIDKHVGGNLENCTIQEVSTFGNNSNLNRTFTKDDVFEILAGNGTDIGLAAFSGFSMKYLKIQTSYHFIWNLLRKPSNRTNDEIAIGFPKGSKADDSISYA
ncbi:uncharacterized protein LOC118433734 [Folsomia candida]|uniref:uncharacterized protein LOC118433734 n=1 Tax=Folsomia candida TaxID=158441 RepID=UPI0016052F9B|nr:uncharacterized protein LOC118433734 [Folsomia candida]